MAGFVHIWVKTTQHFLECMEKMNVILPPEQLYSIKVLKCSKR